MSSREAPRREYAAAQRGLPLRLFSAVRRRARRAYRWVAGSPPPVHIASDWLERQAAASGGFPLLAGQSMGRADTTSIVLETLAACGRRSQAHAAAEWLIETQAADGSFADTAGEACAVGTGLALAALLAWDRRSEPSPARRHAIQQSAQYLAAAADASPSGGIAHGSLLRWGHPALNLAPLAALHRAGQQLHEPLWQQTAQQAACRLRRRNDLTQWSMPTHWHGLVVDALLELNWLDEAERALQLPAACTTAGGQTPALPDVRWVSASGQARLALCWYALGGKSHGDAAVAALANRQHADGSFPASWGPQAAYHPRGRCVATAALYLAARSRQVAAAFDAAAAPDEPLDPADGRLLAIRRFLEGLPPGSRVIDLGCGQGRYLQWLRQWFPGHRFAGVDASDHALRHLPPGIEGHRASLLDLPLADGQFDAAVCVEALEHALLPAQAVAEMCRIVRPGGGVLVIDKRRRCQPLSEHEPWEVWFEPDELCRLLRLHCESVAAEAIPHGPHSLPTGLFYCWRGTRSAKNNRRVDAAHEAGAFTFRPSGLQAPASCSEQLA